MFKIPYNAIILISLIVNWILIIFQWRMIMEQWVNINCDRCQKYKCNQYKCYCTNNPNFIFITYIQSSFYFQFFHAPLKFLISKHVNHFTPPRNFANIIINRETAWLKIYYSQAVSLFCFP